MKEFFEELKWACTESKLKGFYCMVAALLLLLIIGCVASLVMMIVNIIKFHAFSVLWLALFLVSLIISIGIIIWLKKS